MYFAEYKNVVLGGERYYNKLLTILKNDISTIYCKGSDWFLIISFSYPFKSCISIFQDTSRKEEVEKKS